MRQIARGGGIISLPGVNKDSCAIVLSAIKRISANPFSYAAADLIACVCCLKWPISVLCAVLPEQLRQQNNQCMCVYVQEMERSHIYWTHLCVSCSFWTLVQSAHPQNALTLRHPPFTLPLSLCIFSVPPRSPLECLVPVFFSVYGFQMQIYLLLSVAVVRLSPRPREVWEGRTERKYKGEGGQRRGSDDTARFEMFCTGAVFEEQYWLLCIFCLQLST